jgi:NhaP-type Na+/H+ or K+/H+ antiporter
MIRASHSTPTTMARRARIAILLLGWLIVIGLLVGAFIIYGGTRLSQSHRLTGFPNMPLYGAITWWFFLAIPMIGLTYGVLNEWRKK